MIASFFNRYPGANNPGVYLAAYWPILADMRATIDRAYSKKRSLTPDENERLVRLIDHHNYTMHTVASMVFAGRTLFVLTATLTSRFFVVVSLHRIGLLNNCPIRQRCRKGYRFLRFRMHKLNRSRVQTERRLSHLGRLPRARLAVRQVDRVATDW